MRWQVSAASYVNVTWICYFNLNTMKKTLLILLLLVSVAASAQSIGATCDNPSLRGSGFWMDVTLSSGNLFLETAEIGRPGAREQIDYAADLAFGWRAGRHFAAGAATSAVTGLKSGTFSLPIYLRLRYDILDTFVSPYLNLDIGWSFAVSRYSNYCRNGLFASATIGASFRIEEGHRLYLGVKAGECQISRDSNIRNAVNYSDVQFFDRFRPELRICIGFEL